MNDSFRHLNRSGRIFYSMGALTKEGNRFRWWHPVTWVVFLVAGTAFALIKAAEGWLEVWDEMFGG